MTDEPTRVCAGPAHAQPTRLPLTDEHWHFYRSGPREGRPVSRCKLCRHLARLSHDGEHGLVAAREVMPYLVELLRRCGGALRVEEHYGIPASTVYAITGRGGTLRKLQKRTASRVLVALSEQRKVDRRNGSSESFRLAKVEQVRREERMRSLTGY